MDKTQLISSLQSHGFPKEILKAFEKVPREKFIPEKYKQYAYEDTAISIGHSATISQPYTIVFMLNLLELKPKQKILEIGSGSGYVLALLSEITKGEIFGIEIIKELADKSRDILKDCKNIKIINKSGKSGLKEKAPFDRILISASANSIEEIKPLLAQLNSSGILVAPVKNSIIKIKKQKDKITMQEFPDFVFVELKD